MPTQAPSGPISAAQEWRNNWTLVLAGMIGLTVGVLPSATLGLFMQPLSAAFGWSRTQVSLGLTVFALISLPLMPFAGMLVDRLGPRRVALPGLLLSGVCFAAFGLMTGSYLQWIALWVAYTFASLMTRSLVFSSAISAAFSEGRGLALAVLLCGTAIAMSLGPTMARLLIEKWGWRGGYIGIGIGWDGLALLLAVLFFRDVKGTDGAAPRPVSFGPAQLPGGLTLREAVRSRPMIRIAIAVFLQSVMGTAAMVHLVPMLTHDGLTPAHATTVAAILGVASIAGMLTTGWLIDRVYGGLMPVIGFGGPGVACALLLQANGSVWLLSGAVFMIGYCAGAALQLAVYLTTRYAGLRSFGAIFGVISSIMAGAAGIGPVLAATIFDMTGDYVLVLALGMPSSLLAGLAVFRLGSYPEFAPITPERELSERPSPAV
ncbi:MAG TPA: MFS transporter [Novosphingobium sp.]|nr:MFS transporter [Novosphingobium sp.]